MQSVIAGSTTSRFDKLCAVKSLRLPRRRGNAEGIFRLRHKNQTPRMGCFIFVPEMHRGSNPAKGFGTAAKRRNNAGRRRRFCKVGASQYFVSASIIPLRRRGVFMRRIKTERVFARLNLKIAFYRNLWYNEYISRAALCRLFLSRVARDFFYKRSFNANTKIFTKIDVVTGLCR